jgi:hypothetical protein
VAVAAGLEPLSEQPPGFVSIDRTAALARHVAVTGVDLEGRPTGADTELHNPVRRLGPMLAAAFRFGLTLLQEGNLAIDALEAQSGPDTQGMQTLQVRRQIIEHISDSRVTSLIGRPWRVRFSFDYGAGGR